MGFFNKVFGGTSEPKSKPSDETMQLIENDIAEAHREIGKLREFYTFIEENSKKVESTIKKIQQNENVTQDEIDQIQWSYLWKNPNPYGFTPNEKFLNTLKQGGFTQKDIFQYGIWANSPILSNSPITRREVIGFLLKNCILTILNGNEIDEKYSPFKDFIMANIRIREEIRTMPVTIPGQKLKFITNTTTPYELYDLSDEWELFIRGKRWNYNIEQYMQDKRNMEKAKKR